MKLKVCGITDLNQVQALAEMGVDYIGFIGYAKSPRYAWGVINPTDLASFNSSYKVGVFVNEEVDKVLHIAGNAQLDFIQMHGNEKVEDVQTISKEFIVIKAISAGSDIAQIQESVDRYQDSVDYLLFDTATKNYGGSGKQFEWLILNELSFTKPYFLSGGLSIDTPLNFNHLIKKPHALDINSKFETQPGIKDLDKIQSFVEKLNTYMK